MVKKVARIVDCSNNGSVFALANVSAPDFGQQRGFKLFDFRFHAGSIPGVPGTVNDGPLHKLQPKL